MPMTLSHHSLFIGPLLVNKLSAVSVLIIWLLVLSIIIAAAPATRQSG